MLPYNPEAPPVVYVPRKPHCLNCGRETTLDAWDHAAPCGWTCDRLPPIPTPAKEGEGE